MSEYIIIKDSKIVEHLCGSVPDGAIAVPDGFSGTVGMDAGEFNADWSIKKLSDRIAAGFVSVPSGFKVLNEEIVPMTLQEKVDAKLVTIDAEHVLDTKHGEPFIREKTSNEKIRDGLSNRPKGYKIVENSSTYDGLSLSALSLKEQVEIGDITQQTADTIQALSMRAERDALLAGCDWTQAEDSVLSDEKKAGWKTYRQALRDVPSQGGFPWVITWPVSPDEAKV